MFDPIAEFATSIGIPVAGFRLIVSLFAQYPMASLIYRCKTSFQKHIFSAFFGILLIVFNFGLDVKHCLITTYTTWVLISFLSDRKLALQLSFLFNFGYLLIGYWFVSTDGYDIDWTLPQCVLCLRLIGISFDVFDGSKDQTKLKSDQAVNSIVEPPTLLEMFGFSFFFGTVLTGPQFTLARYRKFVNGDLIPTKKNEDASTWRKSARRAALRRFLLGMFYLILSNVGQAYFPGSHLGTAEYMQRSWLSAVVYLFFAGHFGVRKYFGVWLIVEGACIMTGISFQGFKDDGSADWSGFANVYPWTFETGLNVTPDMIGSFNINTNDWTKRYIFKRLAFLGNKEASKIGALMFLAVWHGFSFGYYVTFLTEFLCLLFESSMKKFHIQYNLNENFFYIWFIVFPVRVIAVAFGYVPFETLTFQRTINTFAATKWVFHLLLLTGLVLFQIFPPKSAKIEKKTK